MKRKTIAILGLLTCTSMFAAPLLFLKGDRLYQANGSDYTYITNGVTRIFPLLGLVLKDDRLHRVTEDGGTEFVAQQVTDVCEGGGHLIKQGRLYAIRGAELEYITGNVTACR